MEISKEIYEEVKRQVLNELEEQKLKKRRIDLAAEAVFAEARRKYMQRLADKYGRDIYGRYGTITWQVTDKFNQATKMALVFVGERSARSAYINGKAEEANKKAEELLEMFLK